MKSVSSAYPAQGTAFVLLLLALLLPVLCQAAQEDVRGPSFILEGPLFSGTTATLELVGETGLPFADDAIVRVTRGKEPSAVAEVFTPGPGGIVSIPFGRAGSYTVTVAVPGEGETSRRVRVYPGFLTILPPVIAILLALIFHQVLPALVAGIWFGAVLLAGMDPLTGTVRLVDTYIVQALTDRDHVRIIIFSMTLGGMVGLISRSGGAAGLVGALSRLSVSRRMSQLSTWLVGLLIFFDDYSNTLMVGNTMRPYTDKMKISREKLSFIVDTTAAPVASVALISTWIGFELALLSAAIDKLGLDANAYWIFLRALPYNFYSWATLGFVLMLVLSGRDFGPMLKAENRTLRTGKVLSSSAQPLIDDEMNRLHEPADAPPRWYNALVPIGVMSVVLVFGLYRSGLTALRESGAEATLYNIIGAADPFQVLLWAAFGGVLCSLAMILAQRILTLRQSVDAFLVGFKSLVLAMVILTLARVIQIVCDDLQTANYLLTVTRGLLSPGLLPVITFILSALTSFSTGTSWGTMAILMPLIIPLSYHLPVDAGMTAAQINLTMTATVGSILSGAVFGDHCSPISDTTIMSSMSCGADHVDHVRTQLPYVTLVAAVSSLLGYLPVGMGLIQPWLALPLILTLLMVLIRVLGRMPQSGPAPESSLD